LPREITNKTTIHFYTKEQGKLLQVYLSFLIFVIFPNFCYFPCSFPCYFPCNAWFWLAECKQPEDLCSWLCSLDFKHEVVTFLFWGCQFHVWGVLLCEFEIDTQCVKEFIPGLAESDLTTEPHIIGTSHRFTSLLSIEQIVLVQTLVSIEIHN
jgi:hypothetical protein